MFLHPTTFLTRHELAELTARRKAKAMGAVLVRLQIPHLLDGDGWPLVLRSVIEARAGGAVVDAQRPVPNFAALKRV